MCKNFKNTKIDMIVIYLTIRSGNKMNSELKLQMFLCQFHFQYELINPAINLLRRVR
jgi:hypothetical protein